MRRIIAILMAALMVMAFITGCGAKESPPAETSGTSDTKTSGEGTGKTGTSSSEQPKYPEKYDPPIEIEIFRGSTETDINEMAKVGWTIEDNAWLDYYYENYGIKVKYRWITDDSVYNEKVQLAISSGDIPDMFKAYGQHYVRQLYDAGLIQPLDEVYDLVANEHFRNIYERCGESAFDSCIMDDGKMYAIPQIQPLHDENSYIWIRYDWLEKLGLEPPKTMEDLYNVAKAFKEADLEGTGKAYGLMLDNSIWYPLRGFFWGFGAYPEKWLKNPDGSYVYGALKEEMKPALAMLQKMYIEGIIDSEFGTKDNGVAKQDVMSGRCGILYGGHWESFNIQSMLDTFPHADWRVYDLPSATGEPVKELLSLPAATWAVVSKDCKYPDALIKMLNFCAFMRMEGLESEDPEELKKWAPYWSNPEKGASNLFTAAPFYQHDPYANINGHYKLVEMKKALDEKGIQPTTENWSEGRVNSWKAVFEGKPSTTFGLYGYFGPQPFSALAVLDRQLQANTLGFTTYSALLSDENADKFGMLNQIKATMVTKVITGDLSVEDGFNGFLNDWENLGGPDITKEFNDNNK